MSIQKTALALTLTLAGLTTSYAALAAQPIVGSWYAALPDAYVVTTFLENGTYFYAEDVAGDSVHTGVEWGTYSWDAVSGQVTAASLGDTNGDWGVSGDVDGPLYINVSGNTATVTQPGCPNCTVAAGRVLHPAGSIVGTWLVPDTDPDPGMITFFADGSYIVGEGGVADIYGQPGVERGTYSWDSVTGKLMATSVITDTNGMWGISHPNGGFFTATLTNATLTFMEQGNDPFVLVAGPVPEPETYAMLLAGLGLVGWAVRRQQTKA